MMLFDTSCVHDVIFGHRITWELPILRHFQTLLTPVNKTLE